MDAQCGWCYGNSSNIMKIKDIFKDQYAFELLTGGMWTGTHAPRGGEKLSEFLKTNGPRMSTITGAHLSEAFYRLAQDDSYIFSSLEPNAAICLVKQLKPDAAFLFAKKTQEALYIRGERLDKLQTYVPILNELSIDRDVFKLNWMRDENLANVYREFSESSKYANGFPTLLRQNGTKIELIASGYFNLDDVMSRLNMD